MGTSIDEILIELSRIMHFFGRYGLCDLLTILARLMRAKKFTREEELLEWVEKIEKGGGA